MRKFLLGALLVLTLLVAPAPAAITTVVVSVANTETSLLSSAPFAQDVAITNRGSGVSVFIGPTGVTTSNGFQLDLGQTISITAVAFTDIFGIVAAGTEDVHVVRVN